MAQLDLEVYWFLASLGTTVDREGLLPPAINKCHLFSTSLTHMLYFIDIGHCGWYKRKSQSPFNLHFPGG